MKIFKLAFVIVFAVALLRCQVWSQSDYGGPLSQPKESHVDLSDDTLNNFDASSRAILLRYLATSSRWEVREERGVKYAVRREKENGKYETSLNGFYRFHNENSTLQTRVILSFDKPYGFGYDYGNVTRAKAGEKEVAITIEGKHFGSPGKSSYLIIQGAGLFLEIYEQASKEKRNFTNAAYAEVSSELTEVKRHLNEVKSTGILPILLRYHQKHANKKSFSIRDGIQPGIFLLDAEVNSTVEGYVYTKAFNVSTGKRLSSRQMSIVSRRYVGWSSDGKQYFPYHAEVKVSEGNWDVQYEARFELWHHAIDGTETKLAETKRIINGWQR